MVESLGCERERMSSGCGRVSSCSGGASSGCEKMSSGFESMSLGCGRVSSCSLILFSSCGRALEHEEGLV